MNIRKYVDNSCSMIAIDELGDKSSSSDIVCNTIIKNTKSTNSSIFTPPHSLVNSKYHHSAQIKNSIKQQKGQEPRSSRAKKQDHQEPIKSAIAKSQEHDQEPRASKDFANKRPQYQNRENPRHNQHRRHDEDRGCCVMLYTKSLL